MSVTLSGLVDGDQHVGGTYCSHHQMLEHRYHLVNIHGEAKLCCGREITNDSNYDASCMLISVVDLGRF
jgi:hypothetical protein